MIIGCAVDGWLKEEREAASADLVMDRRLKEYIASCEIAAVGVDVKLGSHQVGHCCEHASPQGGKDAVTDSSTGCDVAFLRGYKEPYKYQISTTCLYQETERKNSCTR